MITVRHAVLRAGAHQAVKNRRPLRGCMRAGEEIVLPSYRDVADLLLRDVVVQAQAPVIKETRERLPVVQHVLQFVLRHAPRARVLVLATQNTIESDLTAWRTACGPSQPGGP